MRKKLGVTALLLTLGSLAACESTTAPEAAPDAVLAASMAGGAVMVPITIREAYAPAPDATMTPCEPAAAGAALPSVLLAWGQGTHLGRMTSVLSGGICTVDIGTGLISFTGNAVHTAANGDRLFAEFAGTISPGTLTLSNITFTGGTGRFENVTGYGSGGGTLETATGAGWFEVNGMISRPNGS